MIKTATVALVALLLATGSGARATEPSCADSPARVAACFTVHGRLTYSTGIPNYRIWIVGTKRILGVHGAAGHPWDENQLPDAVERWMSEGDGDGPPHSRAAFGDFVVCPLAPDEPKVMRRVCVASASKLAFRKDFDW